MRRLRKEQKGFVLSGSAMLLVLPAMLLVASFLRVVEIGGETNSLRAMAGRVSQVGNDLERMVNYMDNKGLPINNETLTFLADNYEASTGLLVDLPGVVYYPIWIHVNNTGADHYINTRYGRVVIIGDGVWEYAYEDLDIDLGESPDYDYNEPRLQVERIGENIRVTFLGYGGGYNATVYYDTTVIFTQVGPNGACSDPDNIVIVENVIELNVPVSIKDTREALQYSSTVSVF